jgi:hypothetical protein
MPVQGSVEGFKIFPAKNQNTVVEYKKVCGFDKACNSHGSIQYLVYFRAGVRALGSSARHRRKRFTVHHLRNDYQDVFFYDWLTVLHHVITSGDLQLDAQNSYLFTYNTFIKILYMFRTLPCSSSGGLRRNCIYAASGIVTRQ